MNLDPETQELMHLAQQIAGESGHAAISGAHVLLAALQRPFPALVPVLRASNLSSQSLVNHLGSCLRRHSEELEGQAPYGDMLRLACDGPEAASSPGLALSVAFDQADAAVTEFSEILAAVDSALVERLKQVGGSGAVAEQGGESPAAEDLAPDVWRLLAGAETLVGQDRITLRHLVITMLNQPNGLLARGLIALGVYTRCINQPGFRRTIRFGKQDQGTLDRCSDYVRGHLLVAAARHAKLAGKPVVDEKSLVFALIEDARQSTASVLKTLDVPLNALELWVQEQPDPIHVLARAIPLAEVPAFFKARVVNQDQAIEEMFRPIYRLRTGMSLGGKLAGVFLLVGPPGVGKTYLGSLVSQALYDYDPEDPEARLVVIECGKYKERHEVTALLGAAPGYVGMDAGVLINGVRDKAPCVILFDEAERMHPCIWDSLLTAFNDGKLRDNYGRAYSLEDCLVILTSNKGIELAENYRRQKLLGENAAADALVRDARHKLGQKVTSPGGVRQPVVLDSNEFWSVEEYREAYRDILLSTARDHFGPAFYSRIDEKIGFNGLREEDYVAIARLALNDLVTHVKHEKGIQLWCGEDVPKIIAQQTRSLIDGDARAVSRFVVKHILDGAVVPLVLKGEPLAPSYRVNPIGSHRGERYVLRRFELIPEGPPAQGSEPDAPA